MATGRTFPHALVIIDFETTNLPEGNDFTDVHVLEAAVLVTDFDLQPYGGYHEVVKLTQAGVDQLRKNPVVAEMHKKNGLLVESRNGTFTLAQVEQEIIKTLKETTTFDKGEFMIAGSGNASFDFPLMKQKMPELASYFAYYPSDIGVFRRMAKMFSGGKDLVNPTPSSYVEGVKTHRAWDDVQAHHEEYKTFAAWIRKAYDIMEKAGEL